MCMRENAIDFWHRREAARSLTDFVMLSGEVGLGRLCIGADIVTVFASAQRMVSECRLLTGSGRNLVARSLEKSRVLRRRYAMSFRVRMCPGDFSTLQFSTLQFSTTTTKTTTTTVTAGVALDNFCKTLRKTCARQFTSFVFFLFEMRAFLRRFCSQIS